MTDFRKKNEEQQKLKQRRDKAHALLKRAKTFGWANWNALWHDYEEARVAYAETRGLRWKSGAWWHGKGVASYLHGDARRDQYNEPMYVL